MILLDTDHLSLLQDRDAPVAFALQARLEAFPPDEVVTTVITMEEQVRGWLALIHRVTDAQRQVTYEVWCETMPVRSAAPHRHAGWFARKRSMASRQNVAQACRCA